MMDEKTQDYLRRNLVLAKAEGVQAGLKSIMQRLVAMHRPPQSWLMTGIRIELEKMGSIIFELHQHREELQVILENKER